MSFFKVQITDAGRGGFAPREKNDCTVRAVATLFAVDYAIAHDALRLAGRRFRCRFRLSLHFHKVVINGKRLKQLPTSRTNLKEWLSEDTAHFGRDYILGIRGHAFCVKNGVVYDTEASVKFITPRKMALYFYELVDVVG